MQANIVLGDTDGNDRLTWDIVGLDSNKPATSGPDTFPVGYRFCNTENDDETNVVATFTWDDTVNDAYIYLHLDTNSILQIGTLAANSCTDVYFNIQLNRVSDSFDKTRGYLISLESDDATAVTTPSTNQIYVEHLVSQNRNEVYTIVGPNTVVKGQTYNFTLLGATAPGGYEQLESFINFPNNIFRIISVSATYTEILGVR